MTDLLLPTDVAHTVRDERRAMIVAEDARVEYRVYASGKRFDARESLFSLSTFRGGRELQTVPALRGVSFTATEGETIGVVGHNGSGKSTLFRAMSGLIPTSEGKIWARDRPVLLGVNAALVPELSGENNIKLGLLAMGFTPEEAAAHVDEIADFAELNEFIHHPMRTYSSGMGARLRFAIASAKAHSILLIDEALAVGDRRFKAKSEKRIRELQDSAGLVMIVSHSVGSLKDTCERVLWIHKGELVADGPSADVIADYVKWTKQPGSTAVGAASAPKSKPAAASKAKPAAGAAPVPASRAAAATGQGRQELSPLEALLAAASTGPVQGENPRTRARRDRFRRTVRDRRRRRITAVALTAGAVLLAVAAGAAIGILTRVPDPAPAPAGAAITDGPAVITTFSPTAASVVCATEDEETTVRLTWRVDNARVVAIATGTAEIDAIAKPLRNDLPAVAVEQELPFVCAEETQVYTLTAEGRDGERVSQAITVTRELVPVAEELPVPQQTQQPVPDRQPQAPQQPAPAPAPEPTSEPEPTEPAPEPTEPAPEPTEPAPEPTEPAPEPTEPAPEPTQPPETEPGPVPVIPVDPTSALDV